MNKLIHTVLIIVFSTATAWAATVDSLIESGNRFWSEGKLEQAESTFREAIELYPEASLPHARLAGLLLSQQRNDEARSEYQQAIMNDPEDPALFLALAIVYLHAKSYSEAQAMVDAALELQPGLENALKLQEYVTARMTMNVPADSGDTLGPGAVPQDVIHGTDPRKVKGSSPH